LLPEPELTRSGYRTYTPEAARVVRFVKRAQRLGFTLDDIEDLLHLADGGPDACDDARTMACSRIADLQQRIDELASMRDALARLTETCDQPRTLRDCPILRDLETAAAAKQTIAECLAALGIDVPIIDHVGRYPSPTVLVDGVDVMRPEAGAPIGDACRLDLPTPQRIFDALHPHSPDYVQTT
jgi:DNA-binding transcriptional MerR regulator